MYLSRFGDRWVLNKIFCLVVKVVNYQEHQYKECYCREWTVKRMWDKRKIAFKNCISNHIYFKTMRQYLFLMMFWKSIFNIVLFPTKNTALLRLWSHGLIERLGSVSLENRIIPWTYMRGVIYFNSETSDRSMDL